MKKPRIWLIAVVAAMLVLAGSTAALATHTDGANGAPTTITLKDALGNPVDSTTPYSPKQTCGTAACHDYGSGTATVTKNQGYGTTAGLAFGNYTVTSHAHGVSVGKHSQQGRNEEFTADQRTIWGAPGFTSSPGMWGRY